MPPGKAITTACLWSGPRNVSTALMYSFAQRSDTTVIDEPLYGHYLRVSGALHPGREEVMAATDCDGDAAMQRILAADYPDGCALLFLKQMAHHLVQLDTSFLKRVTNVFLIRDPVDMLPSLTVQIPHARLEDTGLKMQATLFDELCAAGQSPVVIDSRELLTDPRAVLDALCRRLKLPPDANMLHWQAGPRPEDGIWAKHWYSAVHQSTGFQPYRAKPAFPERLRPLLTECLPFYETLYTHAIKAPRS